jgi:hypothetical protein
MESTPGPRKLLVKLSAADYEWLVGQALEEGSEPADLLRMIVARLRQDRPPLYRLALSPRAPEVASSNSVPPAPARSRPRDISGDDHPAGIGALPYAGWLPSPDEIERAVARAVDDTPAPAIEPEPSLVQVAGGFGPVFSYSRPPLPLLVVERKVFNP